ncbi:IPT/TIG domain-containing protein [Maribacter halichondriae]|uniref:IPT/TIG domain-containing protein n=1 Tax=Maribacter halichondriae TaxID=2980554 RepID=UPI00235847DA|nr:IPT/TIG domain-containing protein [Maribacter sp. Hal144]
METKFQIKNLISLTLDRRIKNAPFLLSLLGIVLFLGAFMGCSKSEPVENQTPDPVAKNPTITSISPTSGIEGTEVTFTGTNFSSFLDDNAVTFNGVAGTVKSSSTKQLIAVVPAEATSGAVAVTVNGKNAQGPSFTVVTGTAFDCGNNEITEDTVWEDVEAGDAIDYIVQCEILVKGNALLTIEPGVIIAFEGEASGIFTVEGGGLKAIGTASDPIKFIGTSENKGVWKGVYFASNHPENRLEHVTVMNAGRVASGQSKEKGAVQLSQGDDSRGAIVNCTISNNNGFGVFITNNSDLDEFSGNNITNNESAPVGLFFNQIGALDEATAYTGNGKNYIEVRQNDLEEEVSMATLNVPYRFVESNRYNINNALTIGAGNILEFTNGAGFRLGEQASDCITTTGSLNATGTDENHIVFKGVTAGKGTWLGIGFNSTSPNNNLIYCDISGGGSANLYNGSSFAANVTLQCEARVKIQNTSITDSGGFGVYMLDEDTKLEDFENNMLTNNELAPILIHFPQVDQLDVASSYAEGNGRGYIEVMGQSITDADLTIAKLEVPYRIGKARSGTAPYVGRALTIEPGVILEFEPSIGIILGHASFDCTPLTGSLHAEGTEEEPIIFRGITEGQGTWRGIGINSSTSANVLKYCEIIGGGGNQMYNAGGQGNIVIHCQGSLAIENSTIKDSGSWGIDFVQGGNVLSESSNDFSNNAAGDIAPN